MRSVELSYTLADTAANAAPRSTVQHPLLAVLAAVHDTGSISGAARRMGLSYRHVWGELKRWETTFGHPLLTWVRGQPATLAPAGAELLRAERLAQARLAPQIDALRHALGDAFATAFDTPMQTLTIGAGHDDSLLQLRDLARTTQGLQLALLHRSGIEALAALQQRHCLLAGFHCLVDTAAQSPTAQACKPWLQPGRQRLIGVALRQQGLLVAAGNPLKVQTLHDLARAGTRFVQRAPGSASRLLLEELLQAQRLDAAAITGPAPTEPTQQAVAEAVASGVADAGLGSQALAQAAGLGFVPLTEEACFFVVHKEDLVDPAVVALLDVLRSAAWRQQLDASAGIWPQRCGEVSTLHRLLPWWPA
jgi:putative molybdopterin biosynthesis protein